MCAANSNRGARRPPVMCQEPTGTKSGPPSDADASQTIERNTVIVGGIGATAVFVAPTPSGAYEARLEHRGLP